MFFFIATTCDLKVYGETSFDMVAQMIDEVNLGPHETFMDLGSGMCLLIFVKVLELSL